MKTSIDSDENNTTPKEQGTNIDVEDQRFTKKEHTDFNKAIAPLLEVIKDKDKKTKNK
jgi:hypothetical protein